MKGTTDRDIMFNMEHGVASVVGYVNSNYAGDLDKMRSTTGYVFTLTGIICQSIVYMSTTETEFMEVVEFTKETLWLTRLVKEFSIEQDRIQLHCNSQSDICLVNNQV